jgi:hypothetical protein
MPTDHEIMILCCTVLLGCIAVVALFYCLKLFCRNPYKENEDHTIEDEAPGEDPQTVVIVIQKQSPLTVLRMKHEDDPVAPV